MLFKFHEDDELEIVHRALFVAQGFVSGDLDNLLHPIAL